LDTVKKYGRRGESDPVSGIDLLARIPDIPAQSGLGYSRLITGLLKTGKEKSARRDYFL
jgi:hypothetical protein